MVEAVRIKKAINYGIVVHKKEKEMKVNSLNIFVQKKLYTRSKGQQHSSILTTLLLLFIYSDNYYYLFMFVC